MHCLCYPPAMLKLYGFRMSQPVRSVMLLLESNKIGYTFENVDVFKGENRKPAFLKISPTGLVPAIQDENGFALSEASAVLTYLCESRNLNAWYGNDIQTRAYVNFWMSWNHHNTRMGTKKILHYKLFPKLANAEEEYKQGQKHFTKSLKFMEGALSQRVFLTGASPTIADLLLLTEIDQHMSQGFNLVEYNEFPQVLRWVGDVKASVGESIYDSVYAPVKETAAKLQLKR